MLSFTSMFLPESVSSQLSKVNDVLNGSILSQYISLGSIQDKIDGLNSSVHLGMLIISLIFGLIGCFLGYKLARFIMGLTGFVAGIVAGYLIVSKLLGLSGILAVATVIITALFFAAISFLIYRAILFIICFLLTFTLAANVIPFTSDIQFFLCTLAGFIVGAISQKFLRPVIILTSAITFGMSCGVTAINLALALNVSLPDNFIFKAGGGVVFSVVGIVVQFLTTSESDENILKNETY